MYLCKVEGKCIATIKNDKLVGYSMLLVQKLNRTGKTTGEIIVTIDTVGCSIGEIVLVTTGTNASYAVGNELSTVDAAIVGIVDNYDFY